MALDFSRQSKVKISVSLSLFLSLSLYYLIWRIYRYLYTFQINELKLLVLQQQSYIQKLELQNKEMDMVLQGLLFPADEVRSILVNNQMKIRYYLAFGHYHTSQLYRILWIILLEELYWVDEQIVIFFILGIKKNKDAI